MACYQCAGNVWIGTSRRFEQSLLRRTDRGQAIQPKLLFFLEGFPIFAASLENLTDAPLDRNHSPQRAFPRCSFATKRTTSFLFAIETSNPCTTFSVRTRPCMTRHSFSSDMPSRVET